MKILIPETINLISSNVPDSSYQTYDNSATYNTGDLVYLSDNHGEYKSKVDNNTGNYPPDNPDQWEWLGTTNRWRMFDQYLNTVTTNPNTIEFEINGFETKGFFLGNIKGNTLTINVIDNSTGNIIENETVNLIPDPLDWEDYFYGEWLYNTLDVYYYDRKSLIRDVNYHIVLDNGDDNAEIGIFVTGNVIHIGTTLFNLNLSALDYSTVIINQTTGATYLQQGNYAKSIQADVWTSTSGVDMVYKKLVNIRGLPCVFLSDDGKHIYNSTIVLGYIKKFETVLKNSTETMISLSIQGLI